MTQQRRDKRNTRRSGNNIVEFVMLAPWFFFLFAGAIDYGFYSYGLVAVQNAARISAMYCSASSSTCSSTTIPCGYALDQLRDLPNVPSGLSTCAATPLVMSESVGAGLDGGQAATVTVTYTSPQLIPIPGLLPGQLTIARTVQMKLRS
jgi:Flp pilus assembly protein TadG